MTGFEVTAGSNAEVVRRIAICRLRALLSGRATLMVYLDGGSDTRRAAREHWREYANSLGVRFTQFGGWAVKLGGD